LIDYKLDISIGVDIFTHIARSKRSHFGEI